VSIIHDRIELTRRIRAYAIRVATLFPHFPQALQTMEHVAAPQQVAAKDKIVPKLGTASSGSERSAPIATSLEGFQVRPRSIIPLGVLQKQVVCSRLEQQS